MRTDTSTAADVAAIRQVVADASEFQDDVERFIPLFTADTTVVNFGGRRVAGRDTLAGAMRQALASPPTDGESVEPLHASSGRLTHVLVSRTYW
ncbi:hypothetical protein [Streptomyces sp. KL118A]|uniref:hypothetical protein n=1 Tax=Streptomyces sp. KL118A TaxID=3045153 RepID=UPI00278BFAE8|nr:hypothetical protein [Streptomyces sp. KL118A]